MKEARVAGINTMLFFIILIVELIVLYLLSQHMSKSMYGLFLLIFRVRTIAISATTLLFFPGTVVHELSHLFVAEILGVHTGKLSLVPENLEEEEVQAGSVQIAKSDPLRRYIIGLAPILVGLVILAALSYWLPQLLSEATEAARTGNLFSSPSTYLLSLIMYLLFTTSNSMFSSKEDLKGFVGFTAVIGLTITAGYIAGIRIGLTGTALDVANRMLDTLVKSTGLVLAINVLLLVVIRMLLAVAEKLFHRRLILK